MTNKELAMSLVCCNGEESVVKILKEENLWDEPSCWRAFGDNENNFSTIGNQQSAPDAALVEKLINSIDAMLMKECYRKGIDPKSNAAPKSICEAVELFYGVKDGSLSNLTSAERTALAQKGIYLAATGDVKKPDLTIVDNGEGQSCNSLPDTILSLNKDNKLKVPFVQGKFNMGGTGVFQFCGYNNMQLVITKRCPALLKENESADWCFTIVRRENQSDGRKSSRYIYLVNIDGTIKSFNAGALELIPFRDEKYSMLEYGMYNKLFNYNIPGYNSRIVAGNLSFRLSTLMPVLAYPIRLHECRDRYSATKGLEQTLSGMQIKLLEDKSENIVEGFAPQSMTINIDGEQIVSSIYVFKRGVDIKQYKEDEGVLFTINGQTHGSLSSSIFNKARLSHLRESILILMDCTNINGRIREDLFMNSRDRLRKSEIRDRIENELIDCLSNNESLLSLQEIRRREAVADRISEDKPLQTVLNNIMKRSKSLSRILLQGLKLQNPFSTIPVEDNKEFKGKKTPSFFVIKGQKKDEIYKKEAHLNSKFRIKFTTDVENEYFVREKYRGSYKLYIGEKVCLNHNMSLHNGTANLTISLPEDVIVRQTLRFRMELIDHYMIEPIINQFEVYVENELQPNEDRTPGKRLPPNSDNPKTNSPNTSQGGLAMPTIVEVTQNMWDDEKYRQFSFTHCSALVVDGPNADESYDFYINMDNKYLRTEIKPYITDSNRVKLTGSKFKYGMILIGLSILSNIKAGEIKIDENESETNLIRKTSEMISPVLLPIIESLGALQIDEVLN